MLDTANALTGCSDTGTEARACTKDEGIMARDIYQTLQLLREFEVEKDPNGDRTLYYGEEGVATISVSQLSTILARFAGRTIPLGAVREPEKRRPDSLGAFLHDVLGIEAAIASYVGAMLEKEGHVEAFLDPHHEGPGRPGIMLRFKVQPMT